MPIKDNVFIIAEAGVNHNGDIQLAKQLIDAAAEAKADAVKFQTFIPEKLVSRYAEKAQYQKRNTNEPSESQFDMLKKLALSFEDHDVLVKHAGKKRIQFLSTPFDIPSLDLLVRCFEMKLIKIPSGEITNAPFLLEIARSAKKMILSTGMSTLDEVQAALGVLAFGLTAEISAIPSDGDFEKAFASEEGRKKLCETMTLLHSTSEYPAPIEEVNLRAMNTMSETFGLPVGYSDHTLGIHVSVAAVARGACVIEKHFTLNRSMSGPDHKSSLEPDELKEMVRQIREIEKALGDGIKSFTMSEKKNRDIARRSLVLEKAVKAGEVFTRENISLKRPGTGLSPFKYWEKLGEKAVRDMQNDEILYE
jgi:N-acetylneuraminate synthase